MFHLCNVQLDVRLHLAIFVMCCVDFILYILLEIKHLLPLAKTHQIMSGTEDDLPSSQSAQSSLVESPSPCPSQCAPP